VNPLVLAGRVGVSNPRSSRRLTDALIGRVTSPVTGQAKAIPATGYYFADTPENKRRFLGWMKAVHFMNVAGVFLNTLTIILMCWLAYALLMPTGKVPKAGTSPSSSRPSSRWPRGRSGRPCS